MTSILSSTPARELYAPVTKASRINSVDVIRGVALLGILLMNIVGFGLPYPSYDIPTVTGEATQLNIEAWRLASIFFEGTMRGLFSLLFGAGVILLTSRLEQKGAGIVTADVYFRRTIWLFIFGIIHGYLLLWVGDILYSYGLIGLFLFTFRHEKVRTLFLLGFFLIFCGMLWSYLDYRDASKAYTAYQAAQEIKMTGDSLSADQQRALTSWDMEYGKIPPPKIIEKRAAGYRKGYFDIVEMLAPINRMIQSKRAYRYYFWDIFSFMLFGMALFKLGVFQNKLSWKVYALMVIVGYGIGIPVNIYETQIQIETNFGAMASYQAGLTYEVGRFFVTMGHLGLIILLYRLPILKFLGHALAAVGRTALTNYIMQSVICNIVFMGFGFALFGKLERYQLYYVVLGVWVAQLIVSPIWLHYFRYGPLEWLWRSLSYKKWQPFRK